MNLGPLKWPRENIETSVLHQFVPQVRIGDVRE
jgi:hypothetical protein